MEEKNSNSKKDESENTEEFTPETTPTAEEIIPKQIEDDMKESYLNYAMSSIIGRALPDVRDGLKPVHRRILYAMHDMGIVHNKPFKKSARIVGEVLGKYHPHGDSAVYDASVRMVQTFSLRYPLIQGQGNFGSIDGDRAAAMRYTEQRMRKEGEELLKDIEKDTVNFKENFDGSLKEPEVLPSKIPNLLINGSTGISVGMATNIPPHNMQEICTAAIHVIKYPDCDLNDLQRIVKGPDFPTGGLIIGSSGIRNAYHIGRGKIKVRAKHNIEDDNKGKKKIIINEIPYQVNKSLLLSHIADLVNDKRISGISDIRDESDKKGMRIVIELKKESNEDLILNQLFKYTNLQVTFGIINLAIVENKPRELSLKAILNLFIKHRKEVIIRRTKYELKKAEDRAHILEGLIIALDDIDNAVNMIKESKSADEAKQRLTASYNLSEKQVNAILDMKLQRLTGLEQDKIREEHKGLLELIIDLKDILANEKRILDIIIKELEEMIENYGDDRKTEIIEGEDDESIDYEDLIAEENVAITITSSGYIKRVPLETYKQQKRGGRGIIAAGTKEEDNVKDVIVASTHDYMLFFTDDGIVQWKKVYQIPQSSRQSRGVPIINLLDLKQGIKVSSYIPIRNFEKGYYLTMITKKGMVKKTPLSEYSRPRKGGIIAINLGDDDELIDVLLTDNNKQLMIATKKGMAIKFHEKDVRAVGRNSIGVRGIKLKQDDKVIGAVTAPDHLSLMTITNNGYGKRTKMKDYRLITRGGIGVRNIITNERNGDVVNIIAVKDEHDILFISSKGIAMRTSASGISIIGRNTQGMRIMRLDNEDSIVGATKIISENEEKAVLEEVSKDNAIIDDKTLEKQNNPEDKE